MEKQQQKLWPDYVFYTRLELMRKIITDTGQIFPKRALAFRQAISILFPSLPSRPIQPTAAVS